MPKKAKTEKTKPSIPNMPNMADKSKSAKAGGDPEQDWASSYLGMLRKMVETTKSTNTLLGQAMSMLMQGMMKLGHTAHSHVTNQGGLKEQGTLQTESPAKPEATRPEPTERVTDPMEQKEASEPEMDLEEPMAETVGVLPMQAESQAYNDEVKKNNAIEPELPSPDNAPIPNLPPV
eukprot:TRINITY_DN86074_c0_g1_i1.p1 TRINITY_DN86074_c0_g1~~TRINITY_DN86074_c0_g1_i1.p1  ORF type:complete len:177 (-),score=17.31 TRINITY_DN86074_c0_g1_i1:22-552(-)